MSYTKYSSKLCRKYKHTKNCGMKRNFGKNKTDEDYVNDGYGVSYKYNRIWSKHCGSMSCTIRFFVFLFHEHFFFFGMELEEDPGDVIEIQFLA